MDKNKEDVHLGNCGNVTETEMISIKGEIMTTNSASNVLNNWKSRALKGIDSHYGAERYYRRANYLMGVPTIILATTITSLSFFFVGREVPIWVQYVVGFSGLIQVILTSLHTWFKYNELAQKHHEAGSEYAAIRRQIEELEAFSEDVTNEKLKEIRVRWDNISKKIPVAPTSVWRATQKAYRGHGTINGKVITHDENE